MSPANTSCHGRPHLLNHFQQSTGVKVLRARENYVNYKAHAAFGSVRGKLKVIFVCGISISMPHKFLFSKSLAKPTSKTRPPGVLAGVDGGWRMESLVAMCFPFSPILRCLHFYSISISTFLFLYFFFFLQPRTRKIL